MGIKDKNCWKILLSIIYKKNISSLRYLISLFSVPIIAMVVSSTPVWGNSLFLFLTSGYNSIALFPNDNKNTLHTSFNLRLYLCS